MPFALQTHLTGGASFTHEPTLVVRRFLRNSTAASCLQLTGRIEVIANQFSETEPGETSFVTCRALDKFGERLQRLIKWSVGRPLFFFGGEQLGGQLADLGLQTTAELMPLSERRYLFVTSPV